MKTILISLLAVVAAAWGLALTVTNFPEHSALPWILRQQGLYLTGLFSIFLMSLSMLLATRPAWLEKPLGGLDRIYRLHKWSGILAIGFGASHWLIKQSGGLIKTLIGAQGRLPKIRYTGLLEVLREFAADLGEPALYIVLAMLVITLWRRFPYHIWRHLHRIMPVLYLMLAFHATMLAPPAYWSQPVGALLAVVLAVGVVASVIVLAGLIGRRRQVNGSVVSVKNEGDVTELTCRLDEQWKSHRAGQFAFVTFDWIEGAHPFTIASADRGDRVITFYIKALGNYTQDLAQRVRAGQKVKIEGPYGCFQLDRNNPGSRQIWVAGGVGVTPFLSWLESLQTHPAEARDADLHYCTRNREGDPFVARLQALCAALPGIRLYVHSDRHGDVLTADSLKLAEGQQKKAEVWFCGPSGLANALKKGLPDSWNGRLRFHQEAFELR
ncbi:MAG: ferric reductase-like transmembrane domain-containing protein [Propionivibrio sp.]|nr:ferric reductase-like transmembrane domain-containing protein [Propionivibrio sp.]MBK9028141.1 ferric reductase-like transmembrane domain-containing protein [Propionivibrio sp.]